jgi:hypothetical protein
MTNTAHVPASSPDDWVAVADRELKNLTGAYKGGLTNDAKIEHALKATEAMLKAVIWKRHGWSKWPARERGTKFLYGHNYPAMLENCGPGIRERLRLSPEHWAAWQVLSNAVLRQARYSPENPSDAETNAVAKAARFPDWGIVPWLKKLYREMP